MTSAQRETVAKILVDLDTALVGHGDCIGADADFDKIAASLGIRRHIYPSNVVGMRAYCSAQGAVEITEPAPPLDRNGWIVRDSQALIATPKEYRDVLRSGTWSTVRKAKAAGLIVYLVLPDGKIAP